MMRGKKRRDEGEREREGNECKGGRGVGGRALSPLFPLQPKVHLASLSHLSAPSCIRL